MKSDFEQTEIEAPYELPEGWEWCRLGDVADCLDGFRKPINATERAGRTGNVPYYGATGQVGWIDDFLTNEELVLLGEDGAPFLDLIKEKAYLISGKAWVNNHAHILRSKYGEIGNRYLLNYLNIFNYSGYVNGTTRLKLTQGEMLKIPVPLPPTLAEQQRIVNRIESMFAKLDEAKEKAQNVVDGFETRKAAILHKAFTGELTANWRKENAVSDDSWVVKTIGECCTSLKYGTAKKSESSGKVAVIRMVNLQHGEIEYDDLVFSNDEEDIEKYSLSKGDVLFNRTNSPEWVGKTSIYRGDIPAIYAGYLIKLDYIKTMLIGDYLNHMLNSPNAKEYCNSVKTDGVNQSNINAQKIGAYEIPVPFLPEQQEIVRILDSVLEKESRAKEASQTVLDQIALLKKSILARAFKGEL